MVSLEDTAFRIIDHFRKIVCTALHYYLALFYMRSKKKVPPIKNSILRLSATELAGRIRERELNSVAVVQAFIDRIREVEPYINSVVDNRFHEALKEAREADLLVASNKFTKDELKEQKPLLGVPFSIKLMLTVKGLWCTAGSMTFKDHRAKEDAVTVTLMKNAGAIALVNTNCAEVGLNCQTINNLHGKTCNPYDTTKTSGGSSGLVSNHGIFPKQTDKVADNYVGTGPMCRYAEDLVTTMKILSIDVEKSRQFGKKMDFKNVNVYYLHSFGNVPLADEVVPEISKAVTKVINHFQLNYGSNTWKICMPLTKHYNYALLHGCISTGPSITKFLTQGKENLQPFKELLKYLCFQSKHTLLYILFSMANIIPFIYNPNKVKYYESVVQQVDDYLNKIMDDNSILVMPTVPFTAPYHYEIIPLIGSICYTHIFNLLGMPVTQCPVGFNKSGLPVGVQIVSKRGNDPLTVACALEVEKAFGGWKPTFTSLADKYKVIKPQK